MGLLPGQMMASGVGGLFHRAAPGRRLRRGRGQAAQLD